MTEDKLDLILSELARLHARIDEIKPVQGTRWKRQEMPEEWAGIAAQLRPDVDVTEAYRDFQDYWIEATGKRAIKANWLTTWKNWIKNTKEQARVKATWRTNETMMIAKAKEVGIPMPVPAGWGWDRLEREIDERLRQ